MKNSERNESKSASKIPFPFRRDLPTVTYVVTRTVGGRVTVGWLYREVGAHEMCGLTALDPESGDFQYGKNSYRQATVKEMCKAGLEAPAVKEIIREFLRVWDDAKIESNSEEFTQAENAYILSCLIPLEQEPVSKSEAA